MDKRVIGIVPIVMDELNFVKVHQVGVPLPTHTHRHTDKTIGECVSFRLIKDGPCPRICSLKLLKSCHVRTLFRKLLTVWLYIIAQ